MRQADVYEQQGPEPKARLIAIPGQAAPAACSPSPLTPSLLGASGLLWAVRGGRSELCTQQPCPPLLSCLHVKPTPAPFGGATRVHRYLGKFSNQPFPLTNETTPYRNEVTEVGEGMLSMTVRSHESKFGGHSA